jgi:hypothetical protein
MAKLQTGTRIFGTANVDSTLVVGNIFSANSTSTTTGSLQVTGGVGISGNVYTSNVSITNNTLKSNATFTLGNTSTTNTASMVYNSTLNSIDFIFN